MSVKMPVCQVEEICRQLSEECGRRYRAAIGAHAKLEGEWWVFQNNRALRMAHATLAPRFAEEQMEEQGVTRETVRRELRENCCSAPPAAE